MKATRFGRWCALVAFAFALVAYSVPAAAQSATLKGKVTGPDGKPVEGASVVIEHVGTARKNTSKTDKRGEYVQVGLTPGDYRVTVTHGDMTRTQDTRLGAEMKELHFDLKPGAAGAPAATGKPSAEELKKHEARIEKVKTAFKEGADATNAGNYDVAIAKFNEVLVDLPTCTDCYVNLGTVYSRQKDWVKAEESYKKALAMDPKSVEAYNGLANAYTLQGKSKEAQETLAEATKLATSGVGGGSATALYNAGIMAWNANDFQKANELFGQAIKTDPKHAEAHFMLGRVLINLGKLGEAATEFETYLKLAPSGPNAKEAQTNFDALKTYRK
jgi:tetratricopeptide (TPR) repeat protein